MNPSFPMTKPLVDAAVTTVMWSYFTLGFLLFFSPRYAWALFRGKDREAAFQRLNHRYFRSFIGLLGQITPGLTLQFGRDIGDIRSSIVVSNHLSYLDPLLLISCFERQKTIVKKTFFRVPVFRSVLRLSGYIPSANGSENGGDLLRHVEGVKGYLQAGGNVFIFPEGTRSRTGRLGPFNKGAFSIASYCRAPIECLLIRETNRLFVPGRFLFNTCVPTAIEVRRIGSFTPDYRDPNFRLGALIAEIRALYEEHLSNARCDCRDAPS
ncbi:MAG: lysophospholipid acyltransferase family protein [Thermodesulfobacteriota bacterium]